jgi:hypothetical protein
MSDTSIYEVEALLYKLWGWNYHAPEPGFTEIDSWIEMVQKSIELDERLDRLHAEVDKAEDAFNAVMDLQRQYEKHLRIYGFWTTLKDG